MWAIGADVHMKTTTSFAFDDEAKPVTDFNRMFKSVRSNREGFILVRMYLENIDYQILMENSSKTHDVQWTWEELGMNYIVAPSNELKKITQSDSKTDKHDAKELATYLVARFAGAKQFHVCYMCSKEDMMNRQLCRTAKVYMVEIGKCKRRIRSHALVYGIPLPKSITSTEAREYMGGFDDPILESLVGMMEDLEKRRDQLLNTIKTRFQGNPIYEKILSIPYFGEITAAYLACFICDIERFDGPKQFVASLGLAPRVRNSSETVSHCGITKKGDPHARWLLIQATIGHVRNVKDSPVTLFFNKKNGGSIELRKEQDEDRLMDRSAIVAASAKMARIIYTLVVKDRTW